MTPAPSCPRVLIVDDDEDDYLIARDTLRDGLGPCHTTWATSFNEGVARLDADTFDVALIDFHLGAETGLDLLALAQQHGWRTPMILLTGLDDADVDRLAAESGAADYLVKQHLEPTMLERAVRYAIARADILAQAKESEERFRSIVEHASDAIVITDDQDHVTLWNPAATTLFGYQPDAVLGAPLATTLQLVSTTYNGTDANGAADAVATRRDGSPVAVEISRAVWNGSHGEHTSYILRDVTERAQLQRRLHEQATTDPLTGLPNRTYFRTALDNATTIANTHPARGYATLFIDLDDFKLINDRYGHATGDDLLRHAATRITAQLRDDDLAARLGGDEFAVLLPGVTNLDTIDHITQRLLTDLSRPYDIAGQRCHVGASIGAALHRPDQNGTDVLQDADIAMYAAKAEGKGLTRTYDPDQRHTLIGRAELVRTLRDTPIDTGFEVHYQPIVNLATSHTIGVEALLRWHHPTLGLLAGDRFITLAEETGLIIPLGQWVLNQALQQHRHWLNTNAVDPRFTMSVNLSGNQVTPDLEHVVLNALADTEIPPERLCLEVTESTLLDATSLQVLAGLHDQGLTIAIDDFGTGYSSLSSLINTPAGIAKIDRSLIQQVHTNQRGATLLQGVISLCHALGLTPLAEGIETNGQAQLLHQLGCTQGQGYYYGRPTLPNHTLDQHHNRSNDVDRTHTGAQ